MLIYLRHNFIIFYYNVYTILITQNNNNNNNMKRIRMRILQICLYDVVFVYEFVSFFYSISIFNFLGEITKCTKYIIIITL